MGKYEQAMEEIIKETFEGAKLITRDGEEGFGYEIGCSDCPMRRDLFSCSYLADLNDNIRKVDNGESNGGKCFEFYPLEQFWDDFSSTHAIDPETGEVFQI